MKALKILFLLMLLSTSIAIFWNNIPLVKEAVHAVLDPTAGFLLNWNIDLGMIFITLVINLGIVLVQKYTTDQTQLRQIKKEQKLLNEEMKKFKNHPEKLMELNKKQLEFIPKTFEITLRPLMYTFIPLILLIRWFTDYFTDNPIKIFGIFSWFWGYLILSILLSSIFRKVFDVA